MSQLSRQGRICYRVVIDTPRALYDQKLVLLECELGLNVNFQTKNFIYLHQSPNTAPRPREHLYRQGRVSSKNVAKIRTD